MPDCTLLPLGDCAVTLDFPTTADSEVRALLTSLTATLRTAHHPAITGLVPAIRTLTVHYDPAGIDFDAISHDLTRIVRDLTVRAVAAPPTVVIPVCYGGDFGPDLAAVAAAHDTTEQAIVAAHTAGEYTVAMIGFLPGFPYLEGLAPALHTPRRATPRTAVPAGSVGIGGASTGIYPFVSPGGWHLIGRTPRALFDPTRPSPSLLQPGDRVRFAAISQDQWNTPA
jgi:inhibitor of KinA